MTQQYIAVGPAPNDGLGDPIRTAFIKCNDNFSQLYSRAQVSPPPTSVGSIGDQAGMYAYDSSYFYYCFSNYTGNTTIWNQIEQAGNISATQILNGTSSIAIASVNANAVVSINGTPNVVVFTSTGANITGYVTSSGNIQGGNIRTVGQLSATGNITGNYFIGNGSQLTGLPATYSNSNVTTLLAAFGSNSISTTGTITSGNITSGNILTNGTASAQGNITTQGAISATGDIITAGLFIGNFAGNITGNLVVNGSNTQVLFNTNGNCDAVGGMTYNKDSNTFIILGTISSQGNTIGGNILTGGAASAGGNITGANLLTGGLVSATSTITSGGNITGANLLTGGLVSATSTITSSGNITGANLLTGGLMSSTGNAIHGNILTGGLVSATGNISGNYLRSTNDVIVGGNVSTTNLTGTGVSVTANITGGNILTGGQVSATGNITGNYFIGNGSQLTGIASPYGNANVTSLLSAFGSNSISTTGTVTASSVVGGVITGSSSSVTGTQTAASTVGGVITGSSTSVTGSQTAASTVGGVITGTSLSVSGNVTGSGHVGTVYTNSIINTGSNATGNIGSSSTYFDTVFAQATTALYADLAEKYTTDAEYAPGTIVSFGGDAEVTISLTDADPLIAGVVSTDPAYLMNSGLTGGHVVAVALTGRVPCRVRGPITRGAMMVSDGTGRARAEANPAMGTVIGKAVESFTGDIGTIEIVVGRL